MSRHLSPFPAKLRRALLAKGFTVLPTCEMCQREVPPEAIQAGLCPNCKVERDEASAYWQAQLDATLADVPSSPSEPMFGSAEAGKPFLPDDEEYWTEQQRLADNYLAAEAEKDESRGQVGNAEDLFGWPPR